MTRDEFTAWLSNHAAVFSALSKHLKEMDGATRPMFEAAWYGILEKVEMQDAAEATRRMLADTRIKPRYLDAHPEAVKRIALGIKAQRDRDFEFASTDGGQLSRCPHCFDRGWVELQSKVSKRTAAHPCLWCDKGRDIWGKNTGGKEVTDEVKKFVTDHLRDSVAGGSGVKGKQIPVGRSLQVVKVKKHATGVETVGWITKDQRFIIHWFPVPADKLWLVRMHKFVPAAIPPRSLDQYHLELQNEDAPKEWLDGKASDVEEILKVMAGQVADDAGPTDEELENAWK